MYAQCLDYPNLSSPLQLLHLLQAHTTQNTIPAFLQALTTVIQSSLPSLNLADLPSADTQAITFADQLTDLLGAPLKPMFDARAITNEALLQAIAAQRECFLERALKAILNLRRGVVLCEGEELLVQVYGRVGGLQAGWDRVAEQLDACIAEYRENIRQADLSKAVKLVDLFVERELKVYEALSQTPCKYKYYVHSIHGGLETLVDQVLAKPNQKKMLRDRKLLLILHRLFQRVPSRQTALKRLFYQFAVDYLSCHTQNKLVPFFSQLHSAEGQLTALCLNNEQLKLQVRVATDHVINNEQSPHAVVQWLQHFHRLLQGDSDYLRPKRQQLLLYATRIQATSYFLDCFQITLGEHLFFSREQDKQLKAALNFFRQQFGSTPLAPHYQLLTDQSIIELSQPGQASINLWAYDCSIWGQYCNPPFRRLPKSFYLMRDRTAAILESEGLVGVVQLEEYGRVTFRLNLVEVALPFGYAVVVALINEEQEMDVPRIAAEIGRSTDFVWQVIVCLASRDLFLDTLEGYAINYNLAHSIDLPNNLREHLPAPPRNAAGSKIMPLESAVLKIVKKHSGCDKQVVRSGLLGQGWRSYSAEEVGRAIQKLAQKEFIELREQRLYYVT